MIPASEQRLSVSAQKLTNEPTGPTWQQLRPGMCHFLELELTCRNANSGDAKGTQRGDTGDTQGTQGGHAEVHGAPRVRVVRGKHPLLP